MADRQAGARPKGRRILALAAEVAAAGVVVGAVSLVLGRAVGAEPAYGLKATALFAVVGGLAAAAFLRRAPWRRFGAANRVTLWRAGLVCLFAGLLGDPGAVARAAPWLGVGTALFFALDGMDGWLARRAGTTSAFGRAFDHEIDALFMLVLSGLVFDGAKAGAWVLIAGGLHYAYLAARRLGPRPGAELPASRRGAMVGVGAALGLAACLVLVQGAGVVAGMVVAALAASFAVDLTRLVRRRGGAGEIG